MTNQGDYYLSYYLQQLRRQKEQSGEHKKTSFFSTTSSLAVLKALHEAEEHRLNFFALAKTTKLNINVIEEVCKNLGAEGLIEIEPEPVSENHIVKLTEKGMAAL